ncbi:hypothetical protein [Mycobacterium sp. URHB0044]|jgi:hypothetical protein|uniref:hypothetical protein n=1 Tax=Mycobacterium sp. URHB0044 TaxID=1380386 RepID=UPI00048DE4AD|nr:hypothetical protein [Mycobacterium sp. URHB0044]
MAEESQHNSHRDAVARVREGEGFAVNLPVVGRVRIPRPEHVAYYGALGALAALEIIEWPIALAIAAGHALAENQHSRVAAEIGEALEDA